MIRSGRDPAPSRWAFRLQRWWLTPLVRRLVGLGLPMVAIGASAAWFFSIESNRDALRQQVEEIRRSVAERPEFMVKVMAIDGASDELAEDIREVMPIDFPVSSFNLELEAMKETVEQLDAVAQAELVIRPGGILELDVVERVPAIIWRDRETLELLDREGRRVSAIASRLERPDLPLIVGEGADKAVPEALMLYAAAAPLEGRLRGLARMGERRWDVVLDRDQRIMLPEHVAIPALEQVIAIHEARDLLERNITHVDMRKPSRPTLRLAAPAVDELHRIRAIEFGE
jgi:cell division protein FtsQ